MSNLVPVAVIRSKLHRPQLPRDVVERPRLTAVATAGANASVTLVSAQAGYGKSTFVSQWLGAGEVPGAWLSLDPGDSDLVRFLTHVVAAVQTVEPDACEELADHLRMHSAATPEEMAGVFEDRIKYAQETGRLRKT